MLRTILLSATALLVFGCASAPITADGHANEHEHHHGKDGHADEHEHHHLSASSEADHHHEH